MNARIFIPILGAFCLTPWVSAAGALLMGIIAALALGNPYLSATKKLTSQLLSLSVMGLGAGMNLKVVTQVGLEGVVYTLIGISSALVLGSLLGKVLKIPKNTSILICVGTAICGGSAIAAAAPTIRAQDHETSVSLATVFILNAVALMIFPAIGHHFNLSQTQFGLWSALAIHDTSSVVGATLQYGAQALEIGTTVKLARALWIVPVTLILGWVFSTGKKKDPTSPKAKKPWFILGFILAAALVTWLPSLQTIGHEIESLAKRTLVLTLFLIGCNLTRDTLKAVGIKPFLQGFFLWIVVATGTLAAIVEGMIH